MLMNQKEFRNYVMDTIKNFLPDNYRDASVELMEVSKMNYNYNAMVIRQGDSRLAPLVDIDQMYNGYRHGKDLDSMLEQVAEMIVKPVNFHTENLSDYESARSNLMVKLSGAEKNSELLETIPHRLVEDLVITYHVVVDQSADNFASVTVTNDMLEHYGISTEQLHQDAMENSQQKYPVKIQLLSDVIFGIFERQTEMGEFEPNDLDYVKEELKEVEKKPALLMISNENGYSGSVVIFYPDVLDQLAERVGGDFFILPSSIHEQLVLQDDGNVDYRELNSMVTEINNTQVDPQERLSDQAYHYDSREKVFERAETFANRQKTKEMSQENDVKKRKDAMICHSD